ncbi:MAG: ShlB/FhaC/HecB family hemolysin secretion/activation protein [Rhodospirillales bacterium]|nr:ShlB/FhaC/HecB family hemolysin secretion/activation protein [Rhodospirillales bacterium]
MAHLIFMVLLILCSSADTANAQASGRSDAEPGKIEDRIKRPSIQAPAAKQPDTPKLPEPYTEPAESDGAFVLAGVEIIGATIYPEAEFAAFYEPLLATEIKVSEIQAITRKITDKYKDDGYFLASAVAEPQDLALGILRIRVIEGAITKVSYSGDLSDRAALLEEFAAKIKQQKPARLDNLERYMLLIDDLPGATVEGSLKPVNKDAGEFELVLAIGHDTTDAYASVDNRGTRSVGRVQALLHGDLNKGVTNSERTGLTLFTIPRTPKELVYGELTHEQHFGTEGLKVWLSASHSAADVGGIYSTSDLGSRGSRAVLGASYPLIRARDQNLTLRTSFDVSNQRQDQDDERISDDRLRILRIGADFNWNDDLDGQNSGSVELSRGYNVMGASDGIYPGQSRSPSLSDGHVSFTKVTAFASRRQKIGDSWAAQLSVTGQKANRQLLSGEEFYLGGSQFGRAFDSGEISADEGAAMSFEVQYGRFLSKPYLDSYQFYGFYDLGVVWEIEEDHFSDGATLSSAGGGMRLGFTKDVFAGLEVAKPLSRIVANEGDKGPRVFFYFLINK